MAEVRFYHLQKSAEENALPQIAYKAWSAGHKVVIRGSDDAQVEKLNNALWTFRGDAFLPHGSKDDGHAQLQPVWLTTGQENPNGAKTLILSAGVVANDIGDYDLCCAMLDGNNEAQVTEARERWKIYKDAGHTVSYWQQTANGWEKKA